MTSPSWMTGPPKTILLATDLSPRCDRALDRAVSLSELWQAKLLVLHVLEDPHPQSSDAAAVLPSWRRPPDPLSVARTQLLADIGPVAKIGSVAGMTTVVIEQGEPADAILRTAVSNGCDLIVTGIARNELLGRLILGATIDRLLRRSHVPILVVKNRARQSYRQIVVATDFSESSRHALHAAARFFPKQRLTIFHAYDAAMSGLLRDPASDRREYRKIAEQDCLAFLQSTEGIETVRRDAQLVIEYGAPSHLLREYARDQGVDLVVLGTHGRSALFEVFIGSVAKQIMADLPSDALVIREPRAATEGPN